MVGTACRLQQIQYRAGEENTVADALSRYGDETPEGTYDCILPRHRFSAKAITDLDTLKGANAAVSPTVLGFSVESYVKASRKRKKFGSVDPVSHAHEVWTVGKARMGTDKAGIGFISGGYLGGRQPVFGEPDDPAAEWEIERFVAQRRANAGDKEYLVRWRGFDWSFDEWVPASHLRNAAEALKEFQGDDSNY
jgi:hypothetical protein